MGILERENAAVMNASLAELSREVVGSFRAALARLRIDAPFFISQNDGTLMSAGLVEQYPVLTFASGPTNSMRGAAYLSGLQDALIADIGGTTTDVGVLRNGFPRESSLSVDIGGVRTNFRMPDVLACGLGGGSLVRESEAGVEVGPRSLGYRLITDALVFGGNTLCATDIAVAAGYADIGDRSRVAHLPRPLVNAAVARIHRIVSESVDRMKSSATPVPLVLVGGGAVLLREAIPGTSEVIVPEHAGVANAIGASIAQISGETDRVFTYDAVGREAALEQATGEARERAIAAGAAPDSLEIIDREEIPLAYMPGGAVRIRVKVSGELDLAKAGAAA
jgi:N-methylhydantoinase A/oxoprolinase/acetone carboxylase beta subunit